jgi:hypothetical protein
LSNNDALVIDLRAFCQKRNKLSHDGIANCLDYDGELSIPETAKFGKTLRELEADGPRLRAAIHLEANKFRAHLDFEAIPENGAPAE